MASIDGSYYDMKTYFGKSTVRLLWRTGTGLLWLGILGQRHQVIYGIMATVVLEGMASYQAVASQRVLSGTKSGNLFHLGKFLAVYKEGSMGILEVLQMLQPF